MPCGSRFVGRKAYSGFPKLGLPSMGLIGVYIGSNRVPGLGFPKIRGTFQEASP